MTAVQQLCDGYPDCDDGEDENDCPIDGQQNAIVTEDYRAYEDEDIANGIS